MRTKVRRRIEQLEAATAPRAIASTKDETAALFEYLKQTALTDRPAYRQLVIEAAKQSREYAEDMVGVGVRYYEEVCADRDFRHEMQDLLFDLGIWNPICWCGERCLPKWNARRRP